MATEQQIKSYFFGLIGKREGDPADDYKQVLQSLVDQGMKVNYVPEEQAKNDPTATFRGVKIVKDGNGTIRGNIQVPAHQRDSNGYYTHEFLVIRDRVAGQPPFVGPFDWGWSDRGGGAPYLLDEDQDGNGNGGGTEPPAEDLTPRVEALEKQNAQQDEQLATQRGEIDELKRKVKDLEGKLTRLGIPAHNTEGRKLTPFGPSHFHEVAEQRVVDLGTEG